MSTTAQTMVSDFRLFVADSDTTVATDFTDAQARTFLNYALLWLYENHERRVKYVTIDTTASNDEQVNGDATFIYPEILGVYVDDGVSDGIHTLRRIGWNEIKLRQFRDFVVDVPILYATLKVGGGAVASGNQNKWLIAFWPIPSGAFVISAIVRDYPVLLSADADLVDLGDFEARLVVLIAVVLAARLKGAPELADNAMQLLPQMLQDKLKTESSHAEAVSP